MLKVFQFSNSVLLTFFPLNSFQALLVNEHDGGFCGGTVLNQFYVLTAAHCINQTMSIKVLLGRSSKTFVFFLRKGFSKTLY